MDALNMAPGGPLEILCVMNLPPDLTGHGGSQRAWRLVDELRAHGNVHFVLVYNDYDRVCIETSLKPLEPLVASITRINISEWLGRRGKLLGFVHPKAVDMVRIGSSAAPRFSRATLKRIAAQLPLRRADIIFAGRLPSAVVVQMLVDKKFLSADQMIVDFDDILSKFRLRQLAQAGADMGIQGRLLGKLDAYLVKQAEDRIARHWDVIGVCSDEDVRSLARTYRQTKIVKIPNVVNQDLIPPRPLDHQFRCLFVGNLSFPPNVHGLKSFIETAWPDTLKAIPAVTLTIVGFNPSADLVELAKANGISLHENVPDVRSYYSDCDVVIAPILFGGGTRVKIVEAMALGRPVVATKIGAEGLNLKDGQQILLVDSMAGFPIALAKLAADDALRARLTREARAFQEVHFGLATMKAAMEEFLMPQQATIHTRTDQRKPVRTA